MNNSQEALCQSIKNLISQKIGIDLATISGINIANVVQRRLGTLEMKKLETYYQNLLTNTANEFDTLVEALVIPETSFFRHPAAFEFLKTHGQQQKNIKNSLRVLSVPCSTGEEPYSIAITLLEAGFLPQQITIDAYDISHEALMKAKQGIYKKYAFRSVNNHWDQQCLNQYFYQQNDLYCIKPEIKEIVDFQIGNLVDPGFLISPYPYDVIFCRNVLIYFNHGARAAVLNKLHKALFERGLLFIGYAETNFVDNRYFQALSIPHAFVYEKKSYQFQLQQTLNHLALSQLPPTQLKPLYHSIRQSPNIYPSKPLLPQRRALSYFPRKSSAKLTNSSADKTQGDRQKLPPQKKSQKGTSSELPKDLVMIRQLADQNHLDQALEQCLSFVKRQPTESKAYLLLGEIYQAKNQDILATSAYKKALYLNPKCEETLIHLIFLSEQLQDLEQAERYRERLKSLES